MSEDKTHSRQSAVVESTPDRKIKFSRKYGVIENGSDNAYPTYIERLIRVSVTASQAASVYGKFIRGNGFAGEVGKVTVGKDRNRPVSLNKLLRKVGADLAKFRGTFIHCQFNLLGEITALTHVPFKHCRFGQKDTFDFSGKIVVYNNWDYSQGRRIEPSKFKIYDAFNPDPDVIQYQIAKAGGIHLYKGQIFHLFLDDEYDYPIATIDAAENDALSEYLMSLFKFNVLDNDFITDRHIFRHHEMEEPDLNKLKKNLKSMKGSRGQGNILMIEDHFDEDLPDGLLRIETIPSGLKTGIFESWEQSCSNNIRREFANVPKLLIDEVEGKLGNSSGEGYKEAQRVYNRMTQEERDELQEAFRMLVGMFDDSVVNVDVNSIEIEPFNIIDEEEDELVQAEEGSQQTTKTKESAEELRLKKQAQATLRGSVGGVTGILGIQRAVSEGVTEYDAGVSVLKEIYGFTQEIAESMLGKRPEEEDPGSQNTDES